jgi:hypothetical protein
MAERAGRGSLTGSMPARADRLPNFRGAITIERDLPAGTMLCLAGWTKPVCTDGPEFISLSVELANKGGRNRG